MYSVQLRRRGADEETTFDYATLADAREGFRLVKRESELGDRVVLIGEDGGILGESHPRAARSPAPETLRFGPLKIVKAHIDARRYRVVVLDMRRPVGDRQVWWAKDEGWTRASRDEARAWLADQGRTS